VGNTEIVDSTLVNMIAIMIKPETYHMKFITSLHVDYPRKDGSPRFPSTNQNQLHQMILGETLVELSATSMILRMKLMMISTGI
jgi:hypothetical protein